MRKFTGISTMAIAVILGTSVMITGCGANGSQEADGEAARPRKVQPAERMGFLRSHMRPMNPRTRAQTPQWLGKGLGGGSRM